jgi:hypothetical protein
MTSNSEERDHESVTPRSFYRRSPRRAVGRRDPPESRRVVAIQMRETVGSRYRFRATTPPEISAGVTRVPSRAGRTASPVDLPSQKR